MLPLHNERSKGIIARILEKGDTNAYTIEKKGIRKMIYQTAWRREDGTVGGIIETVRCRFPPKCRTTYGDNRAPRTRSIRTTQRHQELQPESRKKIHETTPIRYRRRVKRPPFFQNVTKRRIKTVYNTFHSRFPKTGAPAISRGRSCLFAYYRNFSNPGRYLVGSNSTIV